MGHMCPGAIIFQSNKGLKTAVSKEASYRLHYNLASLQTVSQCLKNQMGFALIDRQHHEYFYNVSFQLC